MALEVLVTALAFKETPGEGRRRLEAAGCSLVDSPRPGPLSAGDLLAVLGARKAVIASVDAFTEEIFAASPHLELVSRWGVGVDSVDLAAATRHGVLVAYTPGCTTEAVADYAMGLILAAARRIAEGSALIRGGGWAQLRGVDVWRKTLGIVGFGRIGRAVARRAAAFDMPILAFDPVVPDPLPEGVEMVDLDTLLSRADFVTLHASLLPSTRGMIDARTIGRMKPTAFLINTARGGLVDEEALVRALREGRIAGAAIDVTAVEPLPREHPFRELPNCLLTPHNASYSFETAVAVSEAAAEAVLQVLAGKPPRNVANPEVLDSPNLRAQLSPSR